MVAGIGGSRGRRARLPRILEGERRTPRGGSRTEIYVGHGIIPETQLYFTATRLRLPRSLRTAGATKTNERRRLGDEIRISRYNWKLPPPTSRSPACLASSSRLLLALLFSILSLSLSLSLSLFRFLWNIFPFFLSLSRSVKQLPRMIGEKHGEDARIVRRYFDN